MRDLVGQRDPSGYYVVFLRKCIKDSVLRDYGSRVVLEDYGDLLIVKSRSRSVIRNIVRRFRNYLLESI